MSHPHRQAIRLREKERLMGFLSDLIDHPTPSQEWLLSREGLAGRLNQESENDAQS